MSEIRFYHLQSQSLEQALPALVAKAYENGYRIIIKAPQDRIEILSDALWSARAESFLPHGSERDGTGDAPHHPIWLSDQDDNPNNADMLVLTYNMPCETISNFRLCCEIFDGRIEQDVQAARKRWSQYKEQGHSLTYWQQTPQGGWEKNA